MDKKQDSKISLHEYVVAFIDILGAKNKITSLEFLKVVHRLYLETLNHFHQEAERDIEKIMSIKIFSDNIFIACKIEESQENEHYTEKMVQAFSRVTLFAAMLQYRFIKENILVRGGITKEQLFIDDVLVWGKALVDSYRLENELAYYPRIIISENLLTDDVYKLVEKEIYALIANTVDFDFTFIDYLNTELFMDSDTTIEELISQKSVMLQEATQEKAKIKIKWHFKYLEEKRLQLIQGA